MEILQSQTWDWLICPHQSLRSQTMSFKIKALKKTSYKNLYNFFIFNELIARPLELPEALRTLSLLEISYPHLKKTFQDYQKSSESAQEFQIQLSPAQKSEFGLKIDTQKNIVRKFQKISPEISMELEHFAKIRHDHTYISSERVRDILKKSMSQKIYVIAPGSVWATKMWRTEYYHQLCEKLSRQNFVILVGGPDERKLCHQVAEGLTSVYNAAGETSLWESAELLAAAHQVLTNDSGAMHLASLSSVPVLSIFGPTVLEQGYRPWNNNAQTIESDIYCRPCGKHGAKKCPLGNHACMKLVSVENVHREITRERNPSH